MPAAIFTQIRVVTFVTAQAVSTFSQALNELLLISTGEQ